MRGTWREGSFTGKKFLYYGNFHGEFHRYVKKALQMGNSLHWGPVGEPGGGSFTGTFEKKKCVSGFPFLGPTGH